MDSGDLFRCLFWYFFLLLFCPTGTVNGQEQPGLRRWNGDLGYSPGKLRRLAEVVGELE